MDTNISVGQRIIWVLKALLGGYVISGILILLLSLILCKLGLSEIKVEFGIMIIYALSTLGGGFIIGKYMKVRKYLWGLVIGLCYFIILMLLTLLIYRTLSDASIVNNLIICASCGALGGMFS